jgi:hypothetical protein
VFQVLRAVDLPFLGYVPDEDGDQPLRQDRPHRE